MSFDRHRLRQRRLLLTRCADNLGWKLAHAVHKTAKLDILSTYETERQQVAEDLIK